MIDLGTLRGGQDSAAVAINERGQIIGSSDTASGWGHAFVWEKGRTTDLTLGGKASRALAINERGQVVGWSDTASAPGHGFLWQNGKMRDLGSFIPAGINDRGQIVGYRGRRVLRWEKGHLTDLGATSCRRSMRRRGCRRSSGQRRHRRCTSSAHEHVFCPECWQREFGSCG